MPAEWFFRPSSALPLGKNISLPAAPQVGACDDQLSAASGFFHTPLPKNQRVGLPLSLKFKLAATHFSDQLEAWVELGLERYGVLGAVGRPHAQFQHKQRTYLHFWS